MSNKWIGALSQRYSCERTQRSVTDSGIGLVLCQMMSWRRYQPSACKARATRHGMPIRSLALRPSDSGVLLTSLKLNAFRRPVS